MNQDATMSALRQVLTLLLSTGAVSAYLNGDQATSVVGAVVTLANVAWSVWAHYGMKKVPQDAVVVSAPAGK